MDKKKESEMVYPILMDQQINSEALSTGLSNIKTLPAKPKPYSGSSLDTGFLAFTRRDSGLRLTAVYGKLMPQHILLPQFVELVEQIDETLLIQNFKESDRYGSGSRGQLLATLCKKRSSLVFVQGAIGQVVKSDKDIVKRWEYFIDRSILQAFYVTAKYQALCQTELDSLLSAYDGWIQYKIRDLCS